MFNAYTLEKLTQQTIEAVKITAEFIQQESGKVQAGQIEEKVRSGLVSYVDRTAEKMLVERLGAILPQATFITEEKTVENAASQLVWIIDPLDGTTNFLHDIPHYSISVALLAAGELALGIVYHVPRKECFYAWKSGGAWCNGEPIRVSERFPIRQALIATGFPYHNPSRMEGWIVAVRAFVSQGRAMRRLGSAALDLAYVASGRFDIFFEYGLNDWDIAAGILLVQEAGGKVSDFKGGNNCLNGREMLACNARVYEDALTIMKEAF